MRANSYSQRILSVVVHASTKYDHKGSVKQPIRETIRRLGSPVLEVEEKLSARKHPSYLGTISRVNTRQETAGSLWPQALASDEISNLIKGTNTFVFLGGKATQCLLNAVLSILLSKTTPLETLFSKNAARVIINRDSEDLWLIPTEREGGSLNFHFNCEAIYPSKWNQKTEKQCQDLDWSPSLPWEIMSAIYKANRQNMFNAGFNVREFVDGTEVMETQVSNRKTINLYYWSNIEPMLSFFNAENNQAAAAA